MKVGVVGAHGVVGSVTVPLLLAKGFHVRTIDLRSRESALTRHERLEFVAGDILDGGQMLTAIGGCDVVIHVATAIPKPGPAMDWSKNDAIRRQGTLNLLNACAKSNVRRYIQQSISMLYRVGGYDWLDEDSEISPGKILESAADMESFVKNGDIPWTILRGGLLYGPSTGRDGGWVRQARDGSMRVPGAGDDYISLIHQDDLAAAICAACTAPVTGIFNIVDDTPVTWRELFDFISARLGTADPQGGGALIFPSQRVSNRRARTMLGWAPAYPSYREGLRLT
jgi:nucleoside-diphosphate-sugar epimerase